MPRKRFDVVVVGAGISGLSCASRLRRMGADVLVLERQNRVGGAVCSRSLPGGYLVDDGPQTIRSGDSDLFDDFHELGIASLRTPATPSAKKRYVLVDGHPEPLPTGPGALLGSRLLPVSGKMRLLKEPFVKGSDAPDESVASFFARRIGHHAAERLVDPFVSGVYAGDPDALSMRATFGSVWEGEQEHGSLFRWALARLRAKRAEAKKRSDDTPSRRPELFSFADGLATWPRAMASTVGSERVRLGAELTSLRSGGGWTVRWRESSGQHEVARAARVVLALPAHAAADLLADLAPAEARSLRDISYAPMAVAHLSFPRGAVAHPLDGFGMLCPGRERRSFLGSLWISSLFPGRAPDGTVLMTCFVGGARRPGLARRPDAFLLASLRGELAEILGIEGPPVLEKVARWESAIPQYEFGHDLRIEAAQEAERRNPGLHLTGSWRGGVSLPDCWRNGAELADRMATAEAGGATASPDHPRPLSGAAGTGAVTAPQA
jgi:oxygen-dependent protoporphyrinogen oxidase